MQPKYLLVVCGFACLCSSGILLLNTAMGQSGFLDSAYCAPEEESEATCEDCLIRTFGSQTCRAITCDDSTTVTSTCVFTTEDPEGCSQGSVEDLECLDCSEDLCGSACEECTCEDASGVITDPKYALCP